jgi:acetyl-CoA carboxylase carboxyltransferase component
MASLERDGKTLSSEEKSNALREIQEKYDASTTPLFAAARLWVDGIISPLDTRSVISRGLAMASHNTEIPDWKAGVLQV